MCMGQGVQAVYGSGGVKGQVIREAQLRVACESRSSMVKRVGRSDGIKLVLYTWKICCIQLITWERSRKRTSYADGH